MSQNPFIIYDPAQESSGQSSARVHAARTSYWRRREQNRLDPDVPRPSQTRGAVAEDFEDGPPEALFSMQQAVSISRPASPESILGQSRLDPFDCTSGSRLPQNVRKALEYGKEPLVLRGDSLSQHPFTVPSPQSWLTQLVPSLGNCIHRRNEHHATK